MKRPIDLHAIGERIQFNDARERSNGQRSEATLSLGPGNKGPGAHMHIGQEEGFKVLSGKLIVTIGKKEVTLGPGDNAVIRSGEAHNFRNASSTERVEAEFWYEPALHIEWMLQSMGEDAMARGGDWKKAPILTVIHALWKMRKEYRLAGMPFWLQDALFGTFAFIARLTGAHKRWPLPEGLR
ncbi:MAG: cupin domain-containing protein [Flavobacteriales bacterium]|nr:cupin domain-containing protein [Flavobacteriales bacterium]